MPYQTRHLHRPDARKSEERRATDLQGEPLGGQRWAADLQKGRGTWGVVARWFGGWFSVVVSEGKVCRSSVELRGGVERSFWC